MVGNALDLKAVKLWRIRLAVGGFVKDEKTCILQFKQGPLHFEECFCPDAASQGRPCGPARLKDFRPEVGCAVAQFQKGRAVTLLEVAE